MIKNENLASKISGNVFYVLLSVVFVAIFYWKSGYSTCASVIAHVNIRSQIPVILRRIRLPGHIRTQGSQNCGYGAMRVHVGVHSVAV